MLAILQFVRSQKRKAGFSFFQPMHFGRIGLVIQIVTTKALYSIFLFTAGYKQKGNEHDLFCNYEKIFYHENELHNFKII
ncbi:MAG TPA: hypothetical protein VIJ75_23835, partial [Hanamia sp.]